MPLLSAMVAPVSTEPGVGFTFTMAMVGLTAGFQAEIVPSNVAKMKTAGFPDATSKSVLPLKTIPVGLPVAACPADGIVTRVGGAGCPPPLKILATPLALSVPHHGPVLLRAMPQELIRLGSTVTTPAGCYLKPDWFVGTAEQRWSAERALTSLWLIEVI